MGIVYDRFVKGFVSGTDEGRNSCHHDPSRLLASSKHAGLEGLLLDVGEAGGVDAVWLTFVTRGVSPLSRTRRYTI